MDQWFEDDDDDDDDMPNYVGDGSMNDQFEEVEEDINKSMKDVKSKPIDDILVSDYKNSDPFSQIHRDHSKELEEFKSDDHIRMVHTFLRSCESAEKLLMPEFVIQQMHSLGLVACHLQHQKLSDDCVVVDVLIRNLGKMEDIFLSTTVYLVFGSLTSQTEKPMKTPSRLVNHLFDLRSVTSEEEVKGKLYNQEKIASK